MAISKPSENIILRHSLVKKPILLVTLETVATLRANSQNSHPFGWELFKKNGWPHLSIISDGDTWFHDPKVYPYFDRLDDDGFLVILIMSSFTALAQ